MVGELPDPARSPAAPRPGGRRDRARRAVRAGAGRLGAGEAARRAAGPGRARRRRGRRAPRSAVREAVRAGLLPTAHDVSDGGLACALAESAIAGGVGLQVDLGPLIGADEPEVAVRRGPRRLRARGDAVALERLGAMLVGEVGGRRSRSPPATAGSPSPSPTPRAPGARCRICLADRRLSCRAGTGSAAETNWGRGSPCASRHRPQPRGRWAAAGPRRRR